MPWPRSSHLSVPKVWPFATKSKPSAYAQSQQRSPSPGAPGHWR
jgi:hypothetical protein